MDPASFYKSKKWLPYCYLPKKEREKYYNADALEKAAADIKSIVGEKEKYTIFDAAEFYQTKYHAFQVPWDKMLQYLKGNVITKFYEASGLFDDEIKPFDYRDNKAHKNVTLIIDLVHNRDLREKYPVIEKMEKMYKEKCSEDEYLYIDKNDYIVIGTFDWETIESMFTYSPIDDINYEMLYFYQHS